MTLRSRITVLVAAAVALACLIAGVGFYAVMRKVVYDQVDRSLIMIAADPGLHPGRGGVTSFDGGKAPFGPGVGGPGGFVQLIDGAGQVLSVSRDVDPLSVDERMAAVARGDARPFFTTLTSSDGERMRVLTAPAAPGVAAQVARPLGEAGALLTGVRARLAIGGLAAIVLAAGLGMLVARRAVRPVEELTALAEDVAATGDLSRRIDLGDTDNPSGTGSGDELDRLARTFNAMLENLEQARLAQQQLVADASHELRTPLTSLRTNIEVLALDATAGRGGPGRAESGTSGSNAGLSPADRRRLMDDLTVQLDEFGRLVAALVELTRGARPARATTAVRLDELVEAAADRARAFAGDAQRIHVRAEPVVVHGEADRLDRAVVNLLDNAVKYGAREPIEVEVTHRPADGHRHGTATVSVRDHGPGIAPEHMPHVFERFYRAPSARAAPGSGLGLAIVAQVAEAHGGRVRAANAEGGGTLMTFELPATGALTRHGVDSRAPVRRPPG
ncbi:MAG: sensor histidine kinase [Egibacteraceae bacterium]